MGKFTLQSIQNGTIEDYEITGWMWGAATGWISFNCSNVSGSCATSDYKVTIDQNGSLSGYAWGPQTGWVNFAPVGAGSNTVKINSEGNFTGYAWAEAFGYISFNCSNDNSCQSLDFKTVTDYIPHSARPRSRSVYQLDTSVLNSDPIKNKIEKVADTKTLINKNINSTNSNKTFIKQINGPVLSLFTPPEQPPQINKIKNITEKDKITKNVNLKVKMNWLNKIVNSLKLTSLNFYQFIKN